MSYLPLSIDTNRRSPPGFETYSNNYYRREIQEEYRMSQYYQSYIPIPAPIQSFNRPIYNPHYQQYSPPVSQPQSAKLPTFVEIVYNSLPSSTSSYGSLDNDNQQNYLDKNIKCLPCCTLLSTGTCPYRDRCKFIHDIRITNNNCISRTRKRNFENLQPDLFFWTHSDLTDIYRIIKTEDKNSYNNSCAASMWYHLCNVLNDKHSNCNDTVNIVTGRRRLPIFVVLSLM